MAVRDPLYWNSTTSAFQEMIGTDKLATQGQAIYQYSLNPAVTLSVVASAGSLDAMTDTRYEAGAATSDATDFDTEAETPDISVINTSYDKIDQTVATVSDPGDLNNLAYPIYWDNATNTLQAMTQTDFYDTFIDPAISIMTGSYSNSSQGGTYYVSSSNAVSGMTLVSATPVFVDTRADAAAYTAAGIPETTDQPETIFSYYLHQIDGSAWDGTSFWKDMFYWDNSTGTMQQYTVAQMNTLLQNMMRYHTSSVVGDRITYNINGTGTNRGSMSDTYLSGTSADGYNTLQVGDDYRSQEFPNGTPLTQSVYFLKIQRS